jgi:hypothetical protein
MNSRAFPSPAPFRGAPLLPLVAANLLPVAGVLFWGWKVGDVVWLYWIENVVIGAFNALRMTFAGVTPGRYGPDGGPPQYPMSPAMLFGIRVFLLAFFIVHYSIFCFVHGVFLTDMFRIADAPLGFGARIVASVEALLQEPLGWIAVAGIVASQASAFVYYELVVRESAARRLEIMMFRPYPRVVFIHLFLFTGATVIEVLKSPVAVLVVFVLMKIVLDATLYLFEHRQPARGSG